MHLLLVHMFKKSIAIMILVSSIAPLYAFEATSASFELHGGGLMSITGSSTSATYRSLHGGGQLSPGIIASATKKVFSGILYWFAQTFFAQYDQAHYRWRNDDGSEVTATFAVNEDIQYVLFPKNTIKRLRFQVVNNAWTRGSAPVFTLEVASTTTCGSGTYSSIGTATTSAWRIATSTNLTDGSVTTNVVSGITDAGNAFVAGQIKTTGNTTSAITLPAGSFTEIEYGLVANDVAQYGGTYCFRLTNSGVTTNFVYTNYALVGIESGVPAIGSLDSAVFDTFTTTGALLGPAYNSIMWQGSQNGSIGKVQFQLATSDCPNGQTNYPTCSTGTWSFVGGATCNSSGYYDTTGPDSPVELLCAPVNHNNQRYFRYRVRLCAADCLSNGAFSPIVNDIIVNWSP